MRGLDPRTHLPEQFPLDGLPDSSQSRRGQVPDQVRDRRPAMSKVEPMPARLFLSSGDLMADRRFDFSRALRFKSALAAAADLLFQAAEIAPGFASASVTRGEILP